ncbi:oxidoreductase, partial [Cellulosimicrobium cellulans]|nr:oxidoreductase [Cellulosimicrobium cellulans]
AATSDAADVPPSYRVLSRAATHRALAGGRLGERPARELLDALDEPARDPQDRPDPHDPQDPHDEGRA